MEEFPQLVRDTEPYHFQRQMRRLSDYPRPAQPNTYQPNQRLGYPRRSKTRNYWNDAYKNYLGRMGNA